MQDARAARAVEGDDPDREHEEHDADLGEHLEGTQIGERGARRSRAHQQTTDDVAQDERLPGEPGQRSAEDGRDEDVGKIGEERGVGDHRGRRPVAFGRNRVRTVRP